MAARHLAIEDAIPQRCDHKTQHRGRGRHSTPKYGLLFSASAGCLQHVRYWHEEQGVPLDQDYVDAAMASGAEMIYLKHLPLGVWVKMDKYENCPSMEFLDGEQSPAMRHLVFIEPQSSDVFMFRDYRVKRTGFVRCQIWGANLFNINSWRMYTGHFLATSFEVFGAICFLFRVLKVFLGYQF